MADEAENPESEDGEGKSEKKGSSPIPFIVVGVLGTALGLAVPFVLPESDADAPDTKQQREMEEYVGADVKKIYIDFEEDSTVQNLKDNDLTRFLSVKISLYIAEDHQKEIEKELANKKVELKNWLIGQMADKTLADVSGKEGQNRLRREIRDQFNTILFPDGHDRIFDVYFTEFAVQ